MDPPRGYRFHPKDWELINYYLKPMVLGLVSEVEDEIAEVDILEHEPWHLPAFAAIQSDDPYWYFFYKLRKYKNSNRVVRTTNNGYWKITGQDRNVYCPESGEVIGIKKTLTYYNGRFPNGVKTNWTKQEYHATAANFPDNQEDYVICWLKRKPGDNSSPNEGESSRQVDPDYGNSSGGNTNTQDNPYSLQNLMNNGWGSDPSYFHHQMPMQHGYGYGTQSYNNDYTNQGDQQFLDSLIVDPQDQDGYEHIHYNRSSPPKPLHMVCVDNHNGSEVEIFPSQYGQVQGASNLFNDRSPAKTYGQMRFVQGCERIQPFSNRDFSFHSSTNKDHKIDPKFCDKKPHIPRSQYQRKSYNPSAKAVVGGPVDFTRKSATDDKVGELAKRGTVVDQLMQNSKIESIIDKKMSLNTETKMTLKSNSKGPAGSDYKEFSMFLKTTESSDNSSPLSICLFNAILGVFLLIIVLQEFIRYQD